MQYLKGLKLSSDGTALLRQLHADRIWFDLDDNANVRILQADVARLADGMDRDDLPPPMLWTGIPFPEATLPTDTDYVLSLSVGGTRTGFALMRLVDGEVRILKRDGGEVSGAELIAAKKELAVATPTEADTDSGTAMVKKIAASVAPYLESHRGQLVSCQDLLLSWGFANDVLRTDACVLGGLSAHTTLMSKGQASFSYDLRNQDVGDLFRESLYAETGWRPRVTVANDGIMALHYFLTPENVAHYGRVGLFIAGTGTNFALAEPFAIRGAGVLSGPDDPYVPERIRPDRPLRTGETEERYFVNYETGGLTLSATLTPFDLPSDYPIEENALAGVKAYSHQFRELIRQRIDADLCAQLLQSWDGETPPGGPEVSQIATHGPGALPTLFGDVPIDASAAERVWVVCRAIVARSALHAAMVLAAVSRRRDFGIAAPGRRPDLLAMEGSVWKIPEFPELVRDFWSRLVAPRELAVELTHEKSFDASLAGPVYFAALHQPTVGP